MKKITTTITCFLFFAAGIAQNVGIGTNTPNASALLELQSTNKGLLLPRVADTNAVVSPARGLVIYSTNANALFYYNGNSWQSTANSGSGDLWYKYQDSVLMTDKEYVSINPNPNLKTPMNGLSVTGNLIIQPNVLASNTPPTTAQTLTMNNTSSLQSISSNDSVGRVFDPGGQNVNYFNNMQGNYFVLGATNGLGTTLSFNENDFGIAPGDTLWIGYNSFPTCRTDYVSMLTNTSVPPSTIDLIGGNAYIIFRSNSDGANSKGFDISWKRIYQDIQKKNNTSDAFGNALVFNAENGSFRTGSPGLKLGASATCLGCLSATGTYSFATTNSSATGFHSTALGYLSNARSNGAIAIGERSDAAAFSSIAIGYSSTAAGLYSSALGRFTKAEGHYTSALGYGTTALSYGSTALGFNNDTFPGTSKREWIATDPLIYFGNGLISPSNAVVIYKNANVDINGYTRLGKLSEGAPVIKMKKINIPAGPAVNNLSTYPLGGGITDAKVVGIQVLLNYAGSWKIPPGYIDAAGYEYNVQVQNNGVVIVLKNGNSANIGGKPISIIVTYEE